MLHAQLRHKEAALERATSGAAGVAAESARRVSEAEARAARAVELSEESKV